MRPVDIRIGHQDEAVIPQLAEVELLAADAAAESGDQRADLDRIQHPIEPGLLDVEDLALEGKDRLVAPVTPLLGRASRRITLDEKELGVRRILLLAIGELARQPGDVQGRLPARHLTGPCGPPPGLGRPRRSSG